MKKMRLLSFMQLAECNPEMSFELIQSELQLNEEEVEAFIIEGIYFCKFVINPNCIPKRCLFQFWKQN